MDINVSDIKELYTEEVLQARIQELAEELDKEYNGEEIVAIAVLNGAIYFYTDLTKKMKTVIELDTVHVTSYRGTESTGSIVVRKDIGCDITNKHVLIVEDIIDSGRTLKFLKEYLLKKNPKSLKIAVLLDKKERRVEDVDIDYVGFEIPNKFVVGYGFDIDGKYRSLPYIGYIET